MNRLTHWIGVQKSEAGGLMSLEGGGSLEVDGSTLVGVNGIDGDRLKKSEGKKGTPQSIAGLAVILGGTMGRGIEFDAASRIKGKGTPQSTVLLVGVL
jgi:hypothetical protein